MKDNNSTLVQQFDALVIFTLVLTGVLLFVLNGFADLFLTLGIRQEWLQRIIIVMPFAAAAVFIFVLILRRQPDDLELTQHSLEERALQQQKLRTSIIWRTLILLAALGFHIAASAGWLDSYFKINNSIFGLILTLCILTPHLISETIQSIRLRKIIAVLRGAL